MTATQGISPTLTARTIVDNARALVPTLRERIVETEALRHLPQATIDDAEQAGLFRLLLPPSLGGVAGSLRDFSDTTRILAQGDPTAAWTLAFLIEHKFWLARWPKEVQDEVFGDGRPSLMAGVANPPGKAVPVPGGFEVTGYWGYASGVMHAAWVQVSAIIDGADRPSFFLIPRDEIDVPDTWHMSGMKGTGSHDVKLESRLVPTHRAVDIDLWHSRRNHGATIHTDAPLYSYDVRDVLITLMPSLLVGAVEAMLASYRERLDHRRIPFSPTVILGDTVTGQVRFAKATAALRAAQSVLSDVIDTVDDLNSRSTDELSDEDRATLKLDCLMVVRLAAESLDLIVKGSGSSIFKSADATQHFVRDVQTVISHLTLDEDAMYTTAGQILLGRAGVDPARNFT